MKWYSYQLWIYCYVFIFHQLIVSFTPFTKQPAHRLSTFHSTSSSPSLQRQLTTLHFRNRYLLLSLQGKKGNNDESDQSSPQQQPIHSTNQTTTSLSSNQTMEAIPSNPIQWLKRNFSWKNSLFGFLVGITFTITLIFAPLIQSTEILDFSFPTGTLSKASTSSSQKGGRGGITKTGTVGEDPATAAANAIIQPTILFQNILANLQNDYIDPINTMKLFKTGMQSMLHSLDPYTEYEDLQEAKQFQESVSGKYAGVGMIISDIIPPTTTTSSKGISSNINKVPSDLPGSVHVVTAFEGYAFDGGLRPGDIILSINDIDTTKMNSVQVKDLLRGDPDTEVRIKYLRDYLPSRTSSLTASSSTTSSTSPAASIDNSKKKNNGKLLETTLKRSSVQLSDIRLATLLGNPADGIGYINIAGFNGGLGRDFRNAVYLLRTNSIHDLKGLVIDLRNNPGGLLDAAVEVASYLLPENQEIVSSRGKDGQDYVYRSVTPPIIAKDTKIVVLVNKGSASASEILAGAIQDYDAGVIIGSTPTYGKGLVQKIIPLPFNSALKYTIAKYYTPSGRCIQEIRYTGGRSSGNTNNNPTQEMKLPSKPTEENAVFISPEEDLRIYDLSPAEAFQDAYKKNENDDKNSNNNYNQLTPGKRINLEQFTIPDSERKTFYTKNQHRPVRDGKGIEPDLILPNTIMISPIESFLYNENLFLPFVNEYLPQKYDTSFEIFREQLRNAFQREKQERSQAIQYYKDLVLEAINSAQPSPPPPPPPPPTSTGPRSFNRKEPPFNPTETITSLDNFHQALILNDLFHVPSIEQFYVLNHNYQNSWQVTQSPTKKRVFPQDIIPSTTRTPIDAHFFYGTSSSPSSSSKKNTGMMKSFEKEVPPLAVLGKMKLTNYQQFRHQLFQDFQNYLKERILTSSTSSPSSPSSPTSSSPSSSSSSPLTNAKLEYAKLFKNELTSLTKVFSLFPSFTSLIDQEITQRLIPQINQLMEKDLLQNEEEITTTIETLLLNQELPTRLINYYQINRDDQLSVAMRLLSSSSSSSSSSSNKDSSSSSILPSSFSLTASGKSSSEEGKVGPEEEEEGIPVNIIHKNGFNYYKVLPESMKDDPKAKKVMSNRLQEEMLKQRGIIEKGYVTYESLLSATSLKIQSDTPPLLVTK